MDGVVGVWMAGGTGAAPGLIIGGGFSLAARERARNGSEAGVVAMVICCCRGQVSTFQGRGWVLSRTEATATWSGIEWAATTKKWEEASEFVDGKTIEL